MYYAKTLSKTHTKAGQRNAVINDRFFRRYRMICFTSSLINHYATDVNRVLRQVVGTDIQNSLFNPPPSYRYLGRVSTDRQEAKHTEVIDNTQMSVHIVGAS